jgi:hypothetical protein
MSQGSQREGLLPNTEGHINRAVALNRGLGIAGNGKGTTPVVPPGSSSKRFKPLIPM